jgi:hypothetical protein
LNVEALPYTVLFLLLEAGCGHVMVTFALDVRGTATRGLIRLGASIAVICVGLGVWLAALVAFDEPIGEYPIRADLGAPVRGLAIGVVALALAYSVASWRGRTRSGLAIGAAASAASVALIGVMAAILAPPAWGYAGVLVFLLVGSVALGIVNMAMSLGHWYLVTPRLPEAPIRELTFALMAVLVVEAVVVAVNVAAPGGTPIESGLSMGENPAFWLRVGVGLVFPLVLGYLAWRSSAERAMMSATGLLYIAVGAMLAGETLALGLLLATGVPV